MDRREEQGGAGHGGERTAFAVGDWLIEPELNRISTPTESVYLRRQLMEVLVYLAAQKGRVVTLETLHDELWRGKVVSSGTIYNCIADLRQALSRDGRGVEYIETIPKAGYRLKLPAVTPPSARQGMVSVALLPLVNRTGDPQLDYLCEGVVEEVLQRLKRVPALRVYSAFTLKDERLDPRVVGLRFGATSVLSGSLQCAADRLRLSFRLDDVDTGESLWADRFDHALSDALDVQEQVAARVAQALLPALGHDSLAATQAPSPPLPAALNHFLLGRHLLSKGTEQAFDAAIQQFEQAVAIDPGFSRAHYRLYLACYLRRRFLDDVPGLLDKAREAAARARACGFKAPVPWLHIERRLYPERRIATRDLALEAIGKLAEGDPEWGSFAYEQLSWVLPAVGLFRAARDFALRVFDSPQHDYADSDADEELPTHYAAIGEYDEAIRLWSTKIQKEPERRYFRYERSVLYSRTGQFDYAQRDIEALDDRKFRSLAAAFHHFYRGDAEGVRHCRDTLLTQRNVHPSHMMFLHALLGQVDAAVECYVLAVNSVARSFVDLGPLRAMSKGRLPPELHAVIEQHPRFQGLLREHGMTDEWRKELIARLDAISDLTGIRVG